MITDEEYKFKINVSTEPYQQKTDASACLSSEGAKAIGRNKMAFNECTLTITEFLKLALSGYSFCNIFEYDPDKQYWLDYNGKMFKSYPVYKKGPNKGAMKLTFKADKFFKGSQAVFADIDKTRFSSIHEFIDSLEKKPTLAYPSYSDNCDKNGVVSRRFHLVYVFSRLLEYEELLAVSKAIYKHIEQCTNEPIEDDCGLRPAQYMNGVVGAAEVYQSSTIYHVWDFPFEEQAVEIDDDETEDQEGAQPMFSENLVNDMKNMDYRTFTHYYSHLGYIYRTEDEFWIRGLYQMTNEHYLQLWYFRERVVDGQQRRRKLFKNACLRRLIKPDISPDELLYNLYIDRDRFFDNSDDVITVEVLKRRVKKAFDMTTDELLEFCQWEISYWRDNRPKFIIKSTAAINTTLVNGIRKELRYDEIDMIYDRSISLRENIENGIGVPQATLYRYCNDRKIDTAPNRRLSRSEIREKRQLQKASDIQLFRELYNPGLPYRDNVRELQKAGIKVSLGSIRKWIDRYYAGSSPQANDPTEPNTIIFELPDYGNPWNLDGDSDEDTYQKVFENNWPNFYSL